MTEHEAEVSTLLPLTPTVFHILLAVVEEPRHGYRIMQEVQEASGGQVGLGPGTLYGAIERMVDAGLIEETSPPEGETPSARRRYYGMTALGRRALLAETRRMEVMMTMRVTRMIIKKTRHTAKKKKSPKTRNAAM